MAKIEITPYNNKGVREVLVNGIFIPDVTDVTMYARPESHDEVTIC